MDFTIANQILPEALRGEAEPELRSLPSAKPLPLALDLETDDLVLPGRAFGQNLVPFGITIVRELQDEDLEALLAPGRATPAPPPTIKSIRAVHHKIAQLLASGMPIEDISLATGMSPQGIRRLESDPTFIGLMSHYSGIVELKFVDVVERARDLGIAAMEELRERLEANPASMSNTMLMELIDVVVMKPMTALAAGRGQVGMTAGGGAPAKLEITFRVPTGEVIEG